MGRVIGRLAMGAVGAFSFACYAGVAYLAHRLLWYVVVDHPSVLTLVPVLVAVTLLFAYRNYRIGAGRLADSVPTVEPPGDRGGAFADRVERLCARMDLREPTLLFTDLETPNGFALNDPDGGVVVVDVSLFERLDDAGMEALLAHELAHLERRDGVVRMLAFTGLQTTASVVTLALSPAILLLMGLAKASGWFRGEPASWTGSLAWRVRKSVLAVAMVVPAVGAHLLLERSRRKEYAADRRAAAVTGRPLALADALRTVDDAVDHDRELAGLIAVDEEYAPDILDRLLSTHPDVDERVARLRRIAAA